MTQFGRLSVTTAGSSADSAGSPGSGSGSCSVGCAGGTTRTGTDAIGCSGPGGTTRTGTDPVGHLASGDPDAIGVSGGTARTGTDAIGGGHRRWYGCHRMPSFFRSPSGSRNLFMMSVHSARERGLGASLGRECVLLKEASMGTPWHHGQGASMRWSMLVKTYLSRNNTGVEMAVDQGSAPPWPEVLGIYPHS